MVVHAPDEGAQVAERSFDLAGMRELELFVDVGGMFHWPVLLATLVNACPVCPEFSTGLYFVEQEAVRLQSAGMLAVDEIVRQLATADLLTHDETPVLEVRLVQLHDGLQDMVLLGEVAAELVVPMVNGLLAEMRQGHGLLHGYFLRPAP